MCWLDAQPACHMATTRALKEDYQNLGLMPKPLGAHGSVRRYGQDGVKRPRFIKRAQALGFSLDEVRHLLELSKGEHCDETRSVAREKMELAGRKIEQAMQRVLGKLVRACGTGRRQRGCPIIEALSKE
jgi:MerR family mercuric resistance operon transcriptional regulator